MIWKRTTAANTFYGRPSPRSCSIFGEHPCGKALDVCQLRRGVVDPRCNLPGRVALGRIAASHGLFEGGRWCDLDYGHARLMLHSRLRRSAPSYGAANGTATVTRADLAVLLPCSQGNWRHPRLAWQRPPWLSLPKKKLDISFPKIISGHTGDVARPERGWRQFCQTVGRLAVRAHLCVKPNAGESD